MRVQMLIGSLVLLPLLSGCQQPRDHDHDRSASDTFERRLHCAQFAQSGTWENETDGPFLDQTLYSPSLDNCIFVMRQSFPADKDGEIQNLVEVVDGLSRKHIWSNDPKNGETEEQLNVKLDQELKSLQVVQ